VSKRYGFPLFVSIVYGQISHLRTFKNRHPFHANMVEINSQDVEGKSKVLTSEQAKRLGAVDPEVQVSADEVRNRSRYEQG
jgi:hypothetical protein